jgi:valyl-tRNA synthetase
VTTTTALPKQYDPSEVEPRWLRFWQENAFFHADDVAPAVPYSITLPPPNVTGSLHIGHALGSTLQDVLIRWKRMKGSNAMWMPGVDHASIAVHVLLERDLKRREGKTRFDLGRDEFLRRAWAWKEKSGNRIGEQEKLMGFSLDWPRERFTMDDASNRAVREAFVQLYEQGLIFRAKRMINWDPASQTVVSDLEVDTVEENGSLWEIKYPIVGGGEIVVATTRPETMLGDTAVAVHPEDPRWRDAVGKQVELPLTGRRIPIIADGILAKLEFGTGAVKVTPAHDPKDYECGLRHDLPQVQVIDFNGRMCDPAPAKYVGMTVDDARRAVVADLEALGALGTVKDYKVPRGRSQRSGAVIEPMAMEQWWVKAAPLAGPAIKAVEAGQTRFVPELHTKTFMHWMTDIRDWCISRQLWWGHRIPAWYCASESGCGEVLVSRTDLASCARCGKPLRQDDDVLDTWFSSALWPFSTLGWPDQTKALKTFYPNNVLVTGPDIIFFWVARMMMMGLHFMQKVPFKVVYLTAIVTDENGDKMSKMKGNVIDPLDVVHGATLDAMVSRAVADGVPDTALKTTRKMFAKGIEAMGADALRFALLRLNTGAARIRLSIERVDENRKFINKLWNAARFALMNLDGFDPERFEAQLAMPGGRAALGVADRWILSRLQACTAEVDAALEAFRFADAANAIYHFLWDDYCDWYIELAKPTLQVPDGAGGAAQSDAARAARRHLTQGVLARVLEETMRLLHPFAPFVTEEIWQKLPKPAQLPTSLMITTFPHPDNAYVDPAAEADLRLVQDVVGACRMLKATYNVPSSQLVDVVVRIPAAAKRTRVEQFADAIERLARARPAIAEGGPAIAGAARAMIGSDLEVLLPLGGLIDVPKEAARIQKDIAKSDREIAAIEKRLGNPEFIANAKDGVVDENRARLDEEAARRAALVDALATLERAGGASR